MHRPTPGLVVDGTFPSSEVKKRLNSSDADRNDNRMSGKATDTSISSRGATYFSIDHASKKNETLTYGQTMGGLWRKKFYPKQAKKERDRIKLIAPERNELEKKNGTPQTFRKEPEDSPSYQGPERRRANQWNATLAGKYELSGHLSQDILVADLSAGRAFEGFCRLMDQDPVMKQALLDAGYQDFRSAYMAPDDGSAGNGLGLALSTRFQAVVISSVRHQEDRMPTEGNNLVIYQPQQDQPAVSDLVSIDAVLATELDGNYEAQQTAMQVR